MAGAKMWAIIGGIVAIIGQFWGVDFFLPLIGGVIALIAGLMVK